MFLLAHFPRFGGHYALEILDIHAGTPTALCFALCAELRDLSISSTVTWLETWP